MVIALFIFIIWYMIGCVGFIFWWTKEFDFTTKDILMCLFIGLIGPSSWLLGFYVHGKDTIIINKRK